MSAVDVAAIRARAEAATEGPWRVVGRYVALIGPVGVAQGQPAIDALTETDAEFIVAARTDVPALCDEVERLRVKVAWTRDQRDRVFAAAQRAADDLAAARATLARVKALTDEWDSNPDSECTLGWAADRLNAALSSPESPVVSTRSEGERELDPEAEALGAEFDRAVFAGREPDYKGALAALSAPDTRSEGVDDFEVSIHSTLGEPTTCKVYRRGVLVFDGITRDAALSAPVPDVAAERVAAIKAEALREAADAMDPLTTDTPLGFTDDMAAHWLRHRAAALTADATDGGVSRAATTPDQQGEGES